MLWYFIVCLCIYCIEKAVEARSVSLWGITFEFDCISLPVVIIDGLIDLSRKQPVRSVRIVYGAWDARDSNASAAKYSFTRSVTSSTESPVAACL